MRRYDIVFGILLTLPIIDFALAAPVLVKEKRHAYVYAAQVPKDVVTVLEKRGEDQLLNELFDFEGFESPYAHASSSSAPPRPDHESKVDLAAPGPKLAPPKVNPVPSTEPSSLSSKPTSSLTKGEASNLDYFAKLAKAYFKENPKAVGSPKAFSWSTSAPPRPAHRPKLDVPARGPNLASPTVNSAPLMGPPTGSSMKGATGNFDTFAELQKWYIKGGINDLNKPSSQGQEYIDFKTMPKPVEQ